MKIYRIFILIISAYMLLSCGGADERKAVYLEKAKSSMATGDYDKARIELKNVLQIDPKDGDAFYQLGKVYERQKDYRRAYNSYLKAEELKPELLENQARLGRFYLILLNDPEKTQEKVDLILSKEPGNPDGLLLKAAILLRAKNTSEAVTVTKKILSQHPDHTESIVFLATIYMQNNKLSDAIKLLDDAIKIQPDNVQLSRLLAAALVKNKDFKRAELIYKKFLENNPDSVTNYNNLAAFYNQAGEVDKALETLRASIANDQSDSGRILTLIKYLSTKKGTDKAINELKQFIAENNRLGELRTGLADLYSFSGNKQAAIAVYEKAITDFSEEITGIESRTGLALIYTKDKEYDKALKIIDEALLISPNDPKLNFLRAQFALRDNDLEKAIIALRIVTKETPENIDAFMLLAKVYELQGNNEQVTSTINSAYENNQTNADALLVLAKYHLSGDINMAERIIDKYNALKKSDYEGLSIKAAILNKNKKPTDAFKIAKILMETYPDKPNGYLQALPHYSALKDRDSIVSVLEKGYLSTKDNRKLLTLLSTIQVAEKKFDIVEKRIKAELKATPDDAELKILLAKVYMTNKNTDSAETLLKETIETSPAEEVPYLLLSQIYQSKNDQASAKSILSKGITNVAASIKIPLRLAGLYELEGAHNKAIDVYKMLYEKQPDNLLVINNLVSMLSDHSDNVDDLTLAKTLVSKLEKNGQPVFLDTIGWLYYKVGEYKKAITYLAQVVEKTPQENVFNYHLGMAYIGAGDKENAKLYLEKSLKDSEKFKQKDLAEAALKAL